MKKVISLSTFAFLLFFFGHYNSNGQIQPSNTETITRTSALENAMPSVVSVLSGKGDGLTLINATGIIIRKDGVILTSYEAVKNATQVQIRLSNGEIYDKVDLLAFDERRNVAALKIAGSDLPEIAVNRNEIAAGSRCLTISNAQGQKQSISDGLISGIRMADDIRSR